MTSIRKTFPEPRNLTGQPWVCPEDDGWGRPHRDSINIARRWSPIVMVGGGRPSMSSGVCLDKGAPSRIVTRHVARQPIDRVAWPRCSTAIVPSPPLFLAEPFAFARRTRRVGEHGARAPLARRESPWSWRSPCAPCIILTFRGHEPWHGPRSRRDRDERNRSRTVGSAGLTCWRCPGQEAFPPARRSGVSSPKTVRIGHAA